MHLILFVLIGLIAGALAGRVVSVMGMGCSATSSRESSARSWAAGSSPQPSGWSAEAS